MPKGRGFWSAVGIGLAWALAGLVIFAIVAAAALFTADPWGNFWKIAGVAVLIIIAGQVGHRLDEQINARHRAVIARLDEIAQLLRNR